MDWQEFQCDIAMEFRIACPIHFSHATRSDGFQDFVRSNSCSGEHLQTPGQGLKLPADSQNCLGLHPGGAAPVLLAHGDIWATDVVEKARSSSPLRLCAS